MTQFIHKCNRAYSRIFQDGEHIDSFERLAQSRTRSETYVDEDGNLKGFTINGKEVEI